MALEILTEFVQRNARSKVKIRTIVQGILSRFPTVFLSRRIPIGTIV